MRCRERGMALVTVLLLLALLLVLALVLGDKVTRAMRSTAATGIRDEALHAAGGGIEWARLQLAITYPTSSGWSTYLAGAPGGERYPERPVFSTVVGRIPVDIYLRDNPDDDGDPQRDNDLKLLVLARARPPGGPDVLVESLCGFTAAAATDYHQAGENGQRNGQTAVGPDQLQTAPRVTFDLQD
jgi:type II secretory pathway pseudopilin PulG